MPLPIAILLVCCGIALAGCDGDEESGPSSDGGSGVYLPEPTPTPTPFAEPLFTELQSGGGSDTTTVEPLLESEEFREILESVRIRQGIAAELDALDPGYDVTPADVVEIEELACRTGIEQTMDRIAGEIPGADLSALLALNRMTSQVMVDCPVGPEDAAYMDELSSRIFSFLLLNTSVVEPAEPEPTVIMSRVYQAGCAVIKQGLQRGIRRMLNTPKGAPGYGLSLALGSVLTECPEWLDGEFGDELRRLAGG